MNKTTEPIKRYAIWYKMPDSCFVYVKSCSVCNRQEKPKKEQNFHQVRYHVGSPLERIHIDILGPMIETQSFIGVLNDHRDHILKFALVAKPLYDIMGPSPTFRWGTELEF